ncbi:PIN2/TERF1-interacting telomerase inhibitor 1-like [Battus philenor]|uniref:PIN2/TERF1-interacting telomerase inhibitor 1-like n=1 Tax=Battus philenor TaxID=42288 RepID=UPI0035CF7A14
MAMLAGPRRKQKVINLRAKNNEWSNDNNKFGQRMLEKMGWTSGKGLGAKENGIVEHVVARYKNDEKGLGFEDRNDQWTKHEDDFNSLLANLSNANEDKQIKLHSGISLEDKSKKSKARIHYHKFTRGKDLSRYSEKDLANIFGKKSFKEKEEIETPLTASVEKSEQVFTEKGSMEDYFKNKMAAIKTRNKNISSENKDTEVDWEDEPKCGFQGFLGTTANENVAHSIDNCEVENEIDSINMNDKGSDEKPKLKKNKKKNKKELSVPDDVTQLVPHKIKKSKRKHYNDSENKLEEVSIESKVEKEVKKSKKEKIIDIQETDADENISKPKKKKKRKNKDV